MSRVHAYTGVLADYAEAKEKFRQKKEKQAREIWRQAEKNSMVSAQPEVRPALLTSLLFLFEFREDPVSSCYSCRILSRDNSAGDGGPRRRRRSIQKVAGKANEGTHAAESERAAAGPTTVSSYRILNMHMHLKKLESKRSLRLQRVYRVR